MATLAPSRLSLESIWQAEGSDLRSAAVEFARSYWAQPRRIRDFAVHADGSATFGVVRGVRSYVVTLTRGTYGPLTVVSFVREGE